jgi:anaphase-promoting complex subunit 4
LGLESLSEKTLHQTADPRLIAYCPSMDLLALGSTDQQVLIYRLNGQRVYGTSQKSGTLRVESISWKPNGILAHQELIDLEETDAFIGQLLAIAWSDSSVRLVGAESSKTVHQFSTSDELSGVTCMGWASNQISTNPGSAGPKNGPDPWEALLSDETILPESKAHLDLPRDLALIDIETSMPKLSVLPAGGSS